MRRGDCENGLKKWERENETARVGEDVPSELLYSLRRGREPTNEIELFSHDYLSFTRKIFNEKIR